MSKDIDPNAPRIVIVEDDDLLRVALNDYFTQYGFTVIEFSTTFGVVDWIKHQRLRPETRISVIICDIELPDGNGLELVKRLHPFADLGKILISIRAEDKDRIMGLKTGADDYVCKPLNFEELLLRTQNLMKKLVPIEPELKASEYIKFGHCLLHPENRLLLFECKKIQLTEGEQQILLTLIGKRGKVVSRDTLALALGKHYLNISSRSVDMLVGRLRKKLSDNAKMPEQIVTCRGKGYMLVCSD